MIIRSFVESCLRPFDRMLQLVLPISPHRVCYFSRPDHSDNSYYIYRHLIQTRNNLEHIWLVLDMSIAGRVTREFHAAVQQAGTKGHTLRVVRKRSLMGYMLHLTSRCVFHTHGIYAISNKALRRPVVSLWHGMPIKCVGALNHITPNRNRTFGTFHIATSHFFKFIIACAFEVSPDSVLVSGLPRCDALKIEGVIATTREEVRKRLGIPEGSKLILWMPTYRAEGNDAMKKFRSFLDDLEDWMVPELSRQCVHNNCFIVVKLHQKDLLNQVGYSFESEHIRLLTSTDWSSLEIQLYDLIAASDALLSDVSSVLIDYLVTGKPIGIAGFKKETYTRDLVFPIEILLSSQRYHHLTEKGKVDRFIQAVTREQESHDYSSDLSSVLYEVHAGSSAAAIVNHVGL